MQSILASLATADCYAKAIDLLLESVDRLSNPPSSVIGCVNWPDATLTSFRTRYPRVELRPVVLPGGEADQRAAVISSKAAFISDILASCAPNATLLYTDADHIVLKELDPWFSEMQNYDLALMHRPQFAGRKRHEYLAGVVGVRNSAAAHRAIRRWQKLMARRTDQWADQETLPVLYAYCQELGIRVWRMGQHVLSADSGNLDAYLWARRNWELELDERLRDNRRILSSLDMVTLRPGGPIPKSDLTVTECDADVAIADLQNDARIRIVNSIVIARGEKIKRLTESLAHSDGQLAALNAILTEQREEIAGVRRELKRSKRAQAQLSRAIAAIYASKSWRITAPFRFASKLMRGLPPKGPASKIVTRWLRRGGLSLVSTEPSEQRERR